MEAKYITAASGEPIQSWVTMYTITLPFNIHKYVVKEKVVIQYFISAEKKNAKEVTFAFKVF